MSDTPVKVIRDALGLDEQAPITTAALLHLLTSDDATPEIALAVASYALDELAAAHLKVAELEQKAVKAAVEALSYSEQFALAKLFDALGSASGLVVASKVADRTGVTRSVIVNAIRKCESAGVISSRSLGMKGTRVDVVVPSFIAALRETIA